MSGGVVGKDVSIELQARCLLNPETATDLTEAIVAKMTTAGRGSLG